MPVIEVDHITKEFQLGQLRSLKQTALDVLARLRGRPVPERAPFKALDDVDFKVEQGEVLGIIGHNGAGKSTLLKLLAGISKPTKGRIDVRGTVAPLIEVSAGFVSELSGRENIYLNASILGLKRAEILKKFDEIVAFAELEEFIDTPIKRYSSGMQVRLGFAVATSIRADILIIDEVLAVGDLAFQRKCFSRIEEIIKRSGSTVLLVSHNIRQVERLCSRALLLERGRIVEDGTTLRVCESFFARMNRAVSANAEKQRNLASRIRSSGEAELLSVNILDAAGNVIDSIISGGTIQICIRFRLNSKLERPELHIGTHTTDFFYLTGSSSALAESRPDLDVGVHEAVQTIPSYPVKAGPYCVRFAILDKHRRVVFNGETLHVFHVLPRASEALQDELRAIDIPVKWSIDGQTLDRSHPILTPATIAPGCSP
jgi:ABC-type polysaccharide/polyol phosphate transport system ATPase subunit